MALDAVPVFLIELGLLVVGKPHKDVVADLITFAQVKSRGVQALKDKLGVLVYKCRNCPETYSETDKGSGFAAHIIVIAEQIEPTCEEAGHVAYFCVVCHNTVQIHTIPATGHVDENADGKCDNVGCGGAVEIPDGSGVCSCICHKDHFIMKIIYKIVRFFWKLFGIGKSCDCGFVHY